MTLLNRLNPTIKCFTLLIIGIVLAFTFSIALNIWVSGVCLLLLMCSSFAWRRFLLLMAFITFAAAGLFMTGYLFGQAPLTTSPLFSLTLSGPLHSALQLTSRLYAFALLGLCFSLTTEMNAFITSLQQQCHLPPRFAYGLLAAVNLAPNMQREYVKSRRALQARGRFAFGLSPFILVPLMIKTIRWSECLALAMASRGFDEFGERSCYRKITLTPFDISFMLTALALFIVAVSIC